jgi:hypothetical protein
MSFRAIASIAAIFLGLLVTAGLAQKLAETATKTACTAAQRGTETCPTYTAPAATAVPNASMDGSMNVAAATSTTLFNGAVPPNAFMVNAYSGAALCVVNDHGPANGAPAGDGQISILAGFALAQTTASPVWTFMTPPGYKPIGPVSIWCAYSTYVAARGWWGDRPLQ